MPPATAASSRHRPHALLHPLERRTLLSALIVNDTPDLDTIVLTATPDGGIRVVLNGTQSDYAPGQYDSLRLESQNFDQITVNATVVPTTVHYLADGVPITVGGPRGLQDIKAPLNLNGFVGGPARPGSAHLQLDDTGDATARKITVDNAGAPVRFAGAAPADITLGLPAGGLSNDTFVLTTGAAAGDAVAITALPFNVGAYFVLRDDTITVGDGTLWNISSPIHVSAADRFGPQTGHTVINVDDSKDSFVGLTYTLFGSLPAGPGPQMTLQVSNPFAQLITWGVGGVETVNVKAGRGDDTFDVQSLYSRQESAGPTTFTLDAGGGNDTVLAKSSAVGGRLYVNGQDGDDTVKTNPIGFTLAPVNPGPYTSQLLSDIQIDGGAGSNVLTVLGPLADNSERPTSPVFLSAGQVSHDGVTIHHANVKLQVENGAYLATTDLGPLQITANTESSPAAFQSPTNLTFNVSQHLQSLEILSGPVTVTPGAHALLRTTSLNIPSGYLDLTDNALEVAYPTSISPFAQIRNWILTGQIHSSSTDPTHALGYVDGATVRVRFTLRGDTNLDGNVDFTDLVALAQHYNRAATQANWSDGDFNTDQAVNFTDLVLLAQNYNTALPTTSPVSSLFSVERVTGAGARKPAATTTRPPVRKMPVKRK